MTSTREIVLHYSAFVEMFEPSKDFSGYNEDETIVLEVKDVPCKNQARNDGGWCAFLWKPVGFTGKWIREEYNGSSPFALWWSEMDDSATGEN
jgi:hypothetical protein